MGNSITGLCWTVDTAGALSTVPQWIKAIAFISNGDDGDNITLNNAAGVRIAKVEQGENTKAMAYQYFGEPGLHAKGVTAVLSNGCTAVIYLS